MSQSLTRTLGLTTGTDTYQGHQVHLGSVGTDWPLGREHNFSPCCQPLRGGSGLEMTTHSTICSVASCPLETSRNAIFQFLTRPVKTFKGIPAGYGQLKEVGGHGGRHSRLFMGEALCCNPWLGERNALSLKDRWTLWGGIL